MNRIAKSSLSAGASLLAATALLILSTQGAFAAPTDPTPSATPAPAAAIVTPTPTPTTPTPTDAPADAPPSDALVDTSSDPVVPMPADAPVDPAGDTASIPLPPVPAEAALTVHAGLTNNPPVAVDDNYTAQENTELTIAAPGLLANDFDLDGDTLSVSNITMNPQHGIVYGLSNAGTFTYLPNAGYLGPDSFQYTANDGTTNSQSATVNITVGFDPLANHAPVSVDDSFSTNKGTPLVVSGPGLFANDTDVDGDPIIAGTVVFPPSHGTVGPIGNDGGFVYTPDPGFIGVDLFSYVSSDGKLFSNSLAEVSITVGAEVETPPVSVNDSYSTVSGAPLTVAAPGFLANDSDNGGPVQPGDWIDIAFSTKHGSLASQQDGSFVYTPDAGFIGTDSFTYTRSDGINEGNAATATITVTASPVVTPPIANPDTYSTKLNTPLVVTSPGFVANDIHPDGPISQAKVTIAAANGTVNSIGADGSFTYTPNAGFIGVDAFEYSIFDGTSWNTFPGVIWITVGAESAQAPVSADDSYEVTAGSTLQVNSPGYMANDTEYGKPVTQWQYVNFPTLTKHGTLAPNWDGSFSYTPDAGFVGTDSFTYSIFDSILTGNVATVTITVDPAPVADPCKDVTGSPIPNCDPPVGHRLAFTGADAGPALSIGASLLALGLLTAGAAAWRRRRGEDTSAE